MFGDRRTPLKVTFTQDSVGPRFEASPSSYNPFDSDTESDDKSTPKPATTTASKSSLNVPKYIGNPFDDDEDDDLVNPFDDDEDDDLGREASSTSSSHNSSAAKYR